MLVVGNTATSIYSRNARGMRVPMGRVQLQSAAGVRLTIAVAGGTCAVDSTADLEKLTRGSNISAN